MAAGDGWVPAFAKLLFHKREAIEILSRGFGNIGTSDLEHRCYSGSFNTTVHDRMEKLRKYLYKTSLYDWI